MSGEEYIVKYSEKDDIYCDSEELNNNEFDDYFTVPDFGDDIISLINDGYTLQPELQ